MKLLLYQYRPAIRLYKYAETLLMMGHDIDIAYSTKLLPLLEFPRPILHLDDFNIDEYDRFLSFNTNILPEGINIPIIQCVGDLKSYDKPNKTEIRSLLTCQFAFFTSQTQQDHAAELVPDIYKRSSVIVNGMVPSLMPTTMEFKKKKYNPGKKLSAVWSGTLKDVSYDKRYLADIFYLLSRRYDLHVYPSAVDLNLQRYGSPRYTVHDTVRPQNLVAELSKYHVGIIVWNGYNKELQASLPNKLFEYLSANLQVVAGRPLAEIERYNDYFNCIHWLDEPDHYDPDTYNRQYVINYSDQIEELEKGLQLKKCDKTEHVYVRKANNLKQSVQKRMRKMSAGQHENVHDQNCAN